MHLIDKNFNAAYNIIDFIFRQLGRYSLKNRILILNYVLDNIKSKITMFEQEIRYRERVYPDNSQVN